MKKSSLLLFGILALSISACGNTSKNGTTKNTPEEPPATTTGEEKLFL